MTGIEIARATFTESGLHFPAIPGPLAARLEEKGAWLFSTRDVPVYPYFLAHYQEELQRTGLQDYVILAHSGHSFNSYAIQYYVVYGAVRILLHHGWGGAYMDYEATTLRANECLRRVDRILATADAHPWSDSLGPLTVVASDFYGSTYTLPGEPVPGLDDDKPGPDVALELAISWLEARQS